MDETLSSFMKNWIRQHAMGWQRSHTDVALLTTVTSDSVTQCATVGTLGWRYFSTYACSILFPVGLITNWVGSNAPLLTKPQTNVVMSATPVTCACVQPSRFDFGIQLALPLFGGG